MRDKERGFLEKYKTIKRKGCILNKMQSDWIQSIVNETNGKIFVVHPKGKK